ncbi:enoyl-CoA hydratase [Cypionkella aquatica]|uniref:Enoyl-CoA hydratase domain-containing protein 3, mitochondrial n=1 Tax=Cypionkella aquatica TaxID=1756042 RepID=A0AA37UC49_9RHOB|nr:enoyl-CoA hydratase [Cypionkella aquatica]GLS88661.1 enoyl-CoA hydratase [Cypionkella aquatica]
MTDQILLRIDHGGIATLTLNAPASFNALSTAMLTALGSEIARLHGDQTIRAVVIKGAGKAFCAGHDLREMQAARQSPDEGRAAFQALFALCAEVMQALQNLPQPTIAQVHGIATAAGCQLAASCDMITAAQGARFGVNGINIGLFCTTPMVALARKIPSAIAFEMLSTGAFIDAARAYEIGLINRLTSPDTLEADTQTLAETLAAKLPTAMRLGKTAFRDTEALDTAEAYARASAIMVENTLLPDTAEGIAAFLEKRSPRWS